MEKVLTRTRRIFTYIFYIDTENYADPLYIKPDIHVHSLGEIKARQGTEDNERNMNNGISVNTFKFTCAKTLVENGKNLKSYFSHSQNVHTELEPK